jgi:hypothetical protein
MFRKVLRELLAGKSQHAMDRVSIFFRLDMRAQNFAPLRFLRSNFFPALYLIPLYLFTPASAQGFLRTDTIKVFNGNNVQLVNPWAGGHNSVQFSAIDLDFDGIKDLVVFDRSGDVPYDKITTYINTGTPNQVSYVHAPQYEKKFPFVHDWMFLVDYNCDGLEDLFTYHVGDFSVYKNTSSNGNLQFTLIKLDVKAEYNQQSNPIPLYTSPTDLPAFADVNNDGDVDVLTWDVIGNNVYYFENMSKERFGTCDSLQFRQYSQCWGHFSGSPNTCNINLNSCTVDTSKHRDPNSQRWSGNSTQVHTGNCLLCLDLDGDTVKDVMNGGIGCCNIDALSNGGWDTLANMIIDDPTFPSYDVPVNLTSFPCPFYVDVNNDGKRDMLVAPNLPNEENRSDLLYYKNNGADDAPVFAYQQNDFLQEGEIEVGAGAYPRFFDIDADGLMDLVIGNHQTIVGPCPNASQFSSLTAYRNVGTATDPQFKFVTNDYGGLMSSLPNILNFAPTFGDIDADGDQDMIVGDANGYLHLFLNTAGAGNPAVFALQNPVNMRDDNNDSIHIPTNYAMPVLFDMDQDNLPDLVIGGRNGNLTYYHNTGTANSPLFTFVTSTLGNVDVWTTCCTGYATPYIFLDSGNIEMYIGSEQGYIYHYTNITGNLSGTFNKADSLLAGANEVWEGLRSAPCVMDVTGDGLPDLVTGNYRGGLAFYKGDMTVGMNSTEVSAEANVSLYPNPAGQTLFYKMSNMDQDVLVEMYDALGKRVLTKRTNVLSGSLDVSALGNGVYTCKFISARTQCVKKVVIDK